MRIALLERSLGCALLMAAACGGDEGDVTTEASSVESGESTRGDPSTSTSTTTAAAESSAASADAGSDAPMLDACVEGPSPGVAVGHGADAFLPFESGPAELIHGVQGGVHILVGIQTWNLDDSDLAVARLRGVAEGGEVLGSSAPYAELECTPDGDAQQALGLFLIWDAAPELLHMQTVTVEVEVTDAAGTVVSTSAQTTIFDPEQA